MIESVPTQQNTNENYINDCMKVTRPLTAQ